LSDKYSQHATENRRRQIEKEAKSRRIVLTDTSLLCMGAGICAGRGIRSR
jgi:hypothetical protein